MADYRLTHAAQADIVAILAWSEEQFGRQARERYEALIVTVVRDAALGDDTAGRTPRPELGDNVFTRHLALSRTHTPGKPVHNPRHFLICREDGDIMIVGRVLHDAMELQRHVDNRQSSE
jgi:toxin ParE1/3/4